MASFTTLTSEYQLQGLKQTKAEALQVWQGPKGLGESNARVSEIKEWFKTSVSKVYPKLCFRI
jgi:hypothetical protein